MNGVQQGASFVITGLANICAQITRGNLFGHAHGGTDWIGNTARNNQRRHNNAKNNGQRNSYDQIALKVHHCKRLAGVLFYVHTPAVTGQVTPCGNNTLAAVIRGVSITAVAACRFLCGGTHALANWNFEFECGVKFESKWNSHKNVFANALSRDNFSGVAKAA